MVVLIIDARTHRGYDYLYLSLTLSLSYVLLYLFLSFSLSLFLIFCYVFLYLFLCFSFSVMSFSLSLSLSCPSRLSPSLSLFFCLLLCVSFHGFTYEDLISRPPPLRYGSASPKRSLLLAHTRGVYKRNALLAPPNATRLIADRGI